MAWLEQKPNGRFHIAFRFAGQKFKKSLRTADPHAAQARLHRLEENIGLVENGRLALPEDVDVAVFLLSDGRLNGIPSRKSSLRTLKQFSESFLNSIPVGSLEDSTLTGMRIHLRHLSRILGVSFSLPTLSLEDLQRYVDRRSKNKGIRGKSLSPATIKKELTTLRTMWNWARNAGHLDRTFPAKGLRYPKSADKPPFQTWGDRTPIELFERDTAAWSTELTQLLTEWVRTAS